MVLLSIWWHCAARRQSSGSLSRSTSRTRSVFRTQLCQRPFLVATHKSQTPPCSLRVHREDFGKRIARSVEDLSFFLNILTIVVVGLEFIGEEFNRLECHSVTQAKDLQECIFCHCHFIYSMPSHIPAKSLMLILIACSKLDNMHGFTLLCICIGFAVAQRKISAFALAAAAQDLHHACPM